MTALRRIGALLGRELRTYFYSPLAWVILTLFLLVQGYSFYLYIELVNRPEAPHGSVMQFFFGGTFLYWVFVIFIVTAITMRLVAEERRSGTLEALMTAPVSETEVVLGKYIAAVLFYTFLWLPTLVYVAIVAGLTEGPVSWGPVSAGYLGTLAVGATSIAVGMLASVLSRNQIIAAVLGFTAMCMLLLVGALELFVTHGAAARVVEHVNLFAHMEEFARGIVDTRRLFFYLTVIVFCLVAASRALEAKKWR